MTHLPLLLALVFAIMNLADSQGCNPRNAPGPGVCQNVNTAYCDGGQYYRGACPGAANIQCCVRSGGSNSDDDNGGNDLPVPTGGGRSGGGGWGSYQAPSGARSVLGNLFSSVTARPVSWGYRGAKATFMLPGGAFYYESKLDTDCDGAPSCPSIDPYGQTQTSWTWSGSPVDALRANYFVLPGNIKSRLGNTRLALGDIAAVIYNGNIVFAVWADSGPTSKIGEGSVKLVQNLGFNPYGRNGKICCGITSGVVTIVFPGSRGSYSSPYDTESVKQAGMARLNALMQGSAALDEGNNNYNGVTGSSLSPITIVTVSASTVTLIAIIIVIVIAIRLNNDRQKSEQRP